MHKPKPGYAYIDTRRKKKNLILKALFARPASSLGQKNLLQGPMEYLLRYGSIIWKPLWKES